MTSAIWHIRVYSNKNRVLINCKIKIEYHCTHVKSIFWQRKLNVNVLQNYAECEQKFCEEKFLNKKLFMHNKQTEIVQSYGFGSYVTCLLQMSHSSYQTSLEISDISPILRCVRKGFEHTNIADVNNESNWIGR